MDCLTPRLAEVPEGDWYCVDCHTIVQSQYEISMSSPDEESTYIPPYYVSSDSSGASAATSDSEATDQSDSSTIDVTGSGLELDLDSICSEQYADSDYVDVEADTEVPLSCKEEPRSGDRFSYGRSLYESRYLDQQDCMKSLGLSSAGPVQISSGECDRQDQCISEGEEIAHKSKLRNNDIIIISSSDDDSLVSLHRKVSSKKKKNTISSESEVSKGESVIDVEECTPSCNETERCSDCHDNTGDIKVDETPSPSKIHVSQKDSLNLEAGPSSSSTPNTWLGRRSQYQARKTSRVKRKRRQRKRRRPRNSRKSNKRRAKRKVASGPVSSVATGVVHRGRARTAATHTPRVSAMRQAVEESYRHQDKTEGLEWARAVLVNARQSPLKKSGLLGSIPSVSGSLICDWQKWKENEKSSSGSDNPYRQRNNTAINKTCNFESNSVDLFRSSQIKAAKPTVIFPKKRQSTSDNSPTQSFSAQDRRKMEIQRRTVSSSKSQRANSPLKAQPHRKNTLSQSKASSDLVDIICKSLDDMEDKCEVKKDGTVVPISKYYNVRYLPKVPKGM